MKRALALVVAAGCGGDPAPVLRPIIDVPGATTDGFPYDGLSDLVLSVARSGDATDIEFASAPIGQPLELNGIGFDNDLVVHLSGRAGEVEASYGRTCAFAVDRNGAAADPHLYFSRIVKWSAGAEPLSANRVGGAAYTTPDGRAVFVGGDDGGTIERYDPQDARFAGIQLDAQLPAKHGARLAALADGRALLVGGDDGSGDGVASTALIDPRQAGVAGARIEVQDGPRLLDHAVVTLVDGSVVAIGGREQAAAGGPFTVSASGWSFRLGDGGGLGIPTRFTAVAAFARAGHTLTRLGDDVGADVLVVGGRDAADLPVAQAELYRPLRDGFEPLAQAVLTVPRWDHVAVRMPGGFVLVAGGLTRDPGTGAAIPATTLELFDPIQGRFAVAGELPATAGITELTATPLPDGRVLLVGGKNASGTPVASVLIARLDSINGQVDVVPTDSLDVPRAGHSAARLCDGTILVVGGAAPGAPGSERYNPPSAGRR